jgi:hypothetical protein
LKATVVVHALGWWNSPTGKIIWKKNIEALTRDVKITRIFIYDKLSSELYSLMEEMFTHNVTVLLVKMDQVPRELVCDFIVADNNLVWTTQVTPDLRLGEHHISIRPQDVNKALDKFEKLRFHATDFEPKAS